MKWNDLTPDQRAEGLIAFYESRHPFCPFWELKNWITDYIEEKYVSEKQTQSGLLKKQDS